MRILVACEESQVVAKAFRAYNHEAFSCDLLPCSGGKSEWHIQTGVENILNEPWDFILAFPPCTHLAVSGAAWFAEKQKDGRQQKAIEFFRLFITHPCPKIVIENPVGIMSTRWRKPDQIIHPWQFGHLQQKKTCLWVKGVPLLQPTNIVKTEMMKLPRNIREKLHYLPPSPIRAQLRSRTFQGIADAMAHQWGS